MSLQSVTSGDSTKSHVAVASIAGGALATITCWILSLFHVQAPPEVEAAFGMVFSVAASWLMQKLPA